ncbi:MAG: hypothetical protein ACI37T_09845 [Candidatus Gastranaerophilaceae bacterium]
MKRAASSIDNRCTYIVLTQKGIDLKPIFENISIELNNILHKNLSKDEENILEKLLLKISE